MTTPATVVAGIDEAGYGPLLGPLVVAAASYVLEPGADEAAVHGLVEDSESWDTLLPTADSKRLYHSGGSLARLELSALGHMLLARGELPGHVAAFLDGAVGCDPAEFEELPWYAGRLLDTPLPRVAEARLVEQRAAAHRDWLAERGARVGSLHIAPVPVPRFNRHATAAGTKAATLFAATSRLVEALVAAHPDAPLVIHVDRQGGRIHYAEALSQAFPFVALTTQDESRERSVYSLDWPGRPPVRLEVSVKADDRRAPVALASVLAKTTREVCMGVLNDWFVERAARRDADAPLAPTAGYGRDAQRYLLEVDRLVLESGATRDMFVRCR